VSSVELDFRPVFDSIEDAYPVSRLQAGMLFHSAYSPETATYHDVFSFHLRAALDVEKLRASIQLMGRRHAALRTSFDLSEFSEPLQLVHSEIETPLEVADLRALAHDDQEEAIREWAEQERKRPFDFKKPALFRVQVHRRSQGTFEFSFSFHHAILDGWSVAVLLTELFRKYLGLLGNQALELPPAPAALFQQFIALERKAIESADQSKFWEEYLEGATVNNIARWPLEDQPYVKRVVQHLQPLKLELSKDLNSLAQSVGVPLKSALLAAHVRVMGMVTGSHDVITGLVVNGRPEEEGGDLAVGLFLNTLPQRIRLIGGPGVSW